MKANYILIVAAAFVISACTKTNEQPGPEGILMTFRAYQEGAQETKTTVQDGGTQVYWEPNDEIKVFFKNSCGRFVSQNSELAGVADFSGTLNIIVGANEGFGASNQTWGLYPYRAEATNDGEYITTTLPASQTGRAGSFAKNTHICLALSSDYNLAFYNVTGGLRFSLTQEGIKSVTFKGNNGESLAGKIKLTFEGGVPAVKEVSEGETTLTLIAPGGGTFQTGKWYYIEALPGTLSNGFKMVFSKGNETAKISSSGSVTISRGKYGSLADADYGLIFKANGGDDPDPSSVIQFADPIAKYACVEKFDTNGDGEVSYAEAAAATSLEGLFTNWNTVSQFDEIKFFSNVTSTVGVFDGLKQLKQIIIPSSIVELGTFNGCSALESVVLPELLSQLPETCFSDCSSLTSVNLPKGITEIPRRCFNNCSSIVGISIPSSVRAIESGAFYGCSSLRTIELPSSLDTIKDRAFERCSSLLSITFPSSLNYIGSRAFSFCLGLSSINLGNSISDIGTFAFQYCQSLSSVILPAGIKSLSQGLFYNCRSLSHITWPSELLSIGPRVFYACRFKNNNSTLEIPSSVTSIGAEALRGVRHIIIPSLSAVNISPDSFADGLTLLYVPDNMIEMYRVRSNWSQYSDYIYPMSDYPVSSSIPIANVVDLGLSVKWASFNLGAKKSEDFGYYYSWGEAFPNWYYDWLTYEWSYFGFPEYSWAENSFSDITKYNYSEDSAFYDNKYTIDLEDDAAHVNWGGTWRMPTYSEMVELLNNCNCEKTTLNGVMGYKFTSRKNGFTDKSIFLPGAGRKEKGNNDCTGYQGTYWTSTLLERSSYDYDNQRAYYFVFQDDVISFSHFERYYGFSIRPVCE